MFLRRCTSQDSALRQGPVGRLEQRSRWKFLIEVGESVECNRRRAGFSAERVDRFVTTGR